MTYTYSASGNPLTIEGTSTSRTLTWDAENRLRMMEDRRTGMLHLYTYNHAGERALKRYGTAQTVAVNGLRAAALLDVSESYSAYVSPYFTENNNRYTKHYYAGTMRLASKIGGAVYKGVDGEQDQSPAGGSNRTEITEDLLPGSTYKAGTDEPDLYFYHTDHLGSTTYITDRKEVAQYVAYTPYGETFKEYKNVTPYKFNGKELDQETGYYYYGARYYDPGTALWFGTDPLAHKYPMNSPYVYCNGNPVRFIDPDGREIKIGTWYGRLLAKFGVNNFEAKVQQYMNNIQSIPSVNNMVEKLEKSSNVYNIKPISKHPENSRTPGKKQGNCYRREDSTIYLNINNTTGYDGKDRPVEAALAHELGHAENIEDGKAVSYDANKAKQGDVMEQEKMIENERNSIDMENAVRKEMGYPERDYDYVKNWRK